MHVASEVIRLSATDLANHLACSHLTELNWRAAVGEIERPIRKDAILQTLIERGLEHEKAYIDHLRGQGKSVHEIDKEVRGAKAIEETLAAMARGVDVIVQGALEDERWNGRPDLLLRVSEPSNLGGWSYEVADTKLSQDTKGGAVLQLCLYADLLGKMQGVVPATIMVVKPGEPFIEERLRADDFMAYYRLVKRELENAVAQTTADATYPNPVPHCDICNWWSRCNQQRRDDDHLSFIAGIGKHQIAWINRSSPCSTRRM